MKQGKLWEAMENMFKKDTGTNIYKIYITCSLKTISEQFNIVKRNKKIKLRGRELKVLSTEGKNIEDLNWNDTHSFSIEIHRPGSYKKQYLLR